MEQTAVVRWGGATSQPFQLSNSTRQGSVMSPAIWCEYCEAVISVRTQGLGCRMYDIFVGLQCMRMMLSCLHRAENAKNY